MVKQDNITIGGTTVVAVLFSYFIWMSTSFLRICTHTDSAHVDCKNKFTEICACLHACVHRNVV